MPPLVNSIGRALLSLEPPSFGVQPFCLHGDLGLLCRHPGGFCFHVPLSLGHLLPQLRQFSIDRLLILRCYNNCHEFGDFRRKSAMT